MKNTGAAKVRVCESIGLALVSATILTITSCSTGSGNKSSGAGTGVPNITTNTVVATEKGVPGGIIIESYEGTGTVTGVDADKRAVTLVRPDGTQATFTAGPEVRNFAQIHVGDKVKAVLTDQLVVFLRKKGAPVADGEAAVVALAPIGAKPGVVTAKTVEVTARVEAVNLEHHQATLRFPDGHSQVVKVRADVDLTQAAIGEEVVIRTTEALALTVEKP